MDDVKDLYEESLDELSGLLVADNVIGEPVETEHGTILPLLSAGFGFGAGGGSSDGSDGAASGGGAGAGGGIEPVAVVVVGSEGVRIERLDDDLWGRLGDAAARLAEQYQRHQAEGGGSGVEDVDLPHTGEAD